MDKKEVLLDVRHLQKYFPVKNFFGTHKGEVKAVDNVSFQIYRGETFGLVGESGCGKSTLGRCILRMVEANGGNIIYKGKDLMNLPEREWKEYRNQLQIIFQDPYSALNPNWNLKTLIEEPMIAQGMQESKRLERVIELLKILKLNEEDLEKFPFEFSGGQRQRIGIARAVATYPHFIFCDEPISALDVSVQAQVINMLKELQENQGLTYLFTAHDLSMVYHVSDRIGVMYLGGMVEIGSSEEVFMNPQHPYTKALISAVPIPDPERSRNAKRILLNGEPPGPMNVPEGCRFCTRCPMSTERCRKERPELREMTPEHLVACWNLA